MTAPASAYHTGVASHPWPGPSLIYTGRCVKWKQINYDGMKGGPGRLRWMGRCLLPSDSSSCFSVFVLSAWELLRLPLLPSRDGAGESITYFGRVLIDIGAGLSVHARLRIMIDEDAYFFSRGILQYQCKPIYLTRACRHRGSDDYLQALFQFLGSTGSGSGFADYVDR